MKIERQKPKILQHYINRFTRLRVDRSHGIAPHKPILLLSLLQAIKNGLITENRISISAELIALFRANWSSLVTTPHHCKFALPFFHLRSSGFWTLKPRPGFETILKKLISINGISQLDSLIEYAEIDQNLFDLMRQPEANAMLTATLESVYFGKGHNNEMKVLANYQQILHDTEGKILNEKPSEYKLEIENLMEAKNDEEIFFRGSLFKKQIPRIYNNTCCISGLKIDSKLNLSMIDACHIKPFSESHDDTITNGISLCPNLHRAFDRGIVSISNDYRVLVSPSFTEETNVYGIKQFENKPILLPEKVEYRPSVSNLEWHRKNRFASS